MNGEAAPRGTPQAPFNVRLSRQTDEPGSERFLWDLIRDRTDAVSFTRYTHCLDAILCAELDGRATPNVCLDDRGESCVDVDRARRRRYSIHGSDAYLVLRAATECFLMQECGRFEEAVQRVYDTTYDGGDPALAAKVREDYLDLLNDEQDGRIIPYFRTIRDKLGGLPLKSPLALGASCYGILRSRAVSPCFIELIWSYWHEEGMLVQTMNAVGLRFQNVRSPLLADPLAHIAIDPLRPLNNLLWGFIQDERGRLTVARRAYEYEHEYGIGLVGKAVPDVRPVDRRSKFIETFHHLLATCVEFFRQADNLTVQADAFPVLNALKDVHLQLAQGAHNGYGDLPWVDRVEKLIMMWLLARPEFHEFLGGRVMVPYSEPWMDRVDTMKTLQGWTDTSVSVFNSLATVGERLLLSIRFGGWSNPAMASPTAMAAQWAGYWRDDIQAYIHDYRTATGVDLTHPPRDEAEARDRALPPSAHLAKRRLASRSSQPALPAASRAGLSVDVRARIPSPRS